MHNGETRSKTRGVSKRGYSSLPSGKGATKLVVRGTSIPPGYKHRFKKFNNNNNNDMSLMKENRENQTHQITNKKHCCANTSSATPSSPNTTTTIRRTNKASTTATRGATTLRAVCPLPTAQNPINVIDEHACSGERRAGRGLDHGRDQGGKVEGEEGPDDGGDVGWGQPMTMMMLLVVVVVSRGKRNRTGTGLGVGVVGFAS